MDSAEAAAPRTLVESFFAHARRAPEQPALLTGERVHTLGELYARTLGAVAQLQGCGVGAGDRVLILGPNSDAFAVAYFASHALGAIAVPVGVDAPPDLLSCVVEQAAPAVLLADGATQASDALDLLEVCATPAEGSPPPAPSGSMAADLLFTTGTTARPKGVLLSHENIAHAARNINAFVGAKDTDIEVVPIPLSHSFGLGRLRCWAHVGHTLSLEPGLRNPARLLKRLVDVRATGLALVPAGFALLRRMVKGRIADVAGHLRYIEIGSAALGTEERAWLLEHLPNTRICHHYGLTEASRAVFKELHTASDDPRIVGRATPNVEVRVVDDAGMSVVDALGEIQVRGGMVMMEYWHEPERTAAVRSGTWLRTGDLGRIDAQGVVSLEGRTSDMINVGGLKVAPQDVESRLLELPGVVDCACVGVPDPDGVVGELVVAFVVAADGFETEAATAHLRAHLSEHQLPRRFELVSSIPRTSSGKVQRAQLRS